MGIIILLLSLRTRFLEFQTSVFVLTVSMHREGNK